AQQIDPCENGKLGPGNADNPQDLKIDHECHVGNGTYNYRDVNIVAGTRTFGKLIFDELIPQVRIHFWARSILLENMGSLLPPTPARGRSAAWAACSPSILTAPTRGLMEQE